MLSYTREWGMNTSQALRLRDNGKLKRTVLSLRRHDMLPHSGCVWQVQQSCVVPADRGGESSPAETQEPPSPLQEWRQEAELTPGPFPRTEPASIRMLQSHAGPLASAEVLCCFKFLDLFLDTARSRR